jgi:hypothetical protein
VTLVNAENIDISSLTALLVRSSALTSVATDCFVNSLTSLKNRWGFTATWVVSRPVSNITSPWTEDSKSYTNKTVMLVRAAGGGSTAINKRSQRPAKDTGNVSLDSTSTVFLFPPLDFVPSTSDSLDIAGEIYRVVTIETVSPNNTVLLYIIGLSQ